MISDFPAAVAIPAPLRSATSPAIRPPSGEPIGAWRYEGRPRSRTLLILAIGLSASLHAALLLGIGPARKKPAVIAQDDGANIIRLAIPDLKDLEEPEPAPTDNSEPPPDLGMLVPMQADLPQLPQPGDFVQQLNFASLLEPPDFSNLKVYVIPEHIGTGRRLAEQIGKIFNISDLDRVPEPILQPSPQFPFAMRREASTGKVMVEFIVDVNGLVLDPVVVDSTHPGFDDAAMAGVSRWKFKPGFKSGRKVNTRMRVPIVFTFKDTID